MYKVRTITFTLVNSFYSHIINTFLMKEFLTAWDTFNGGSWLFASSTYFRIRNNYLGNLIWIMSSKKLLRLWCLRRSISILIRLFRRSSMRIHIRLPWYILWRIISGSHCTIILIWIIVLWIIRISSWRIWMIRVWVIPSLIVLSTTWKTLIRIRCWLNLMRRRNGLLYGYCDWSYLCKLFRLVFHLWIKLRYSIFCSRIHFLY